MKGRQNKKIVAATAKGVDNPTVAERVIAAAPKSSGCYLFKNKLGHVIYVGKAKVLRDRVRQYFNGQDSRPKIENLVRDIADAEYIETRTELDALLQEYRLIQQYRPRYNSQMNRTPEHPYLRIGLSEPFPTISLATEKADDGGNYYGCFYDKYDVAEAIELLANAWSVPRCGKSVFRKNDKPCLYYHAGKCTAPCARMVGESEYRTAIDSIVSFLDGSDPGKLSELRTRMEEHAERLEFEQAAAVCALIDDLERLQRKAGKMFDLASCEKLLLFIKPYRSDELSVFGLRSGEVVMRLDYETADRPIASDILQQFEAASVALPESEWLCKALAEISADKRFVELPDVGDPELTLQTLRQLRGA